ncbi:MAG: 4Fe-4S dicluster domain-containing protein [Candidatus Izemoplasmatales bacterium]
MHVFDTKVQYYKYRTLTEVARFAFENRLDNAYYEIPKIIIPGKKASTRCCIYKERAIIEERVKLALSDEDESSIEVIDIACDECPTSGFTVTESCRGCIAHRCEESCRFNAITFDEHQKAHIDKTKCVNCGKCASACQYSAIINRRRPCEIACKVSAISMSETGEAHIDKQKCVSCGACVYQCPFGAISDKSSIVKVVDMIKGSGAFENYKIYAVVAPSISSQFTKVSLPQVITGIKQLGFYSVVEAALGADLVADEEALEMKERDFMTSSCCPSFVKLIEKHYPKFKEYVSPAPSPMIKLAEYLKKVDPTSKVVFIGPCIAKKEEARKVVHQGLVDAVITFEELQALFDSRDLDLSSMEETILDNASYYGRIFARSGGLTDALKQALKENNIERELNTIVGNGIEECKVNLMKMNRGVPKDTFMEGMSCVGGCIGGPCCLTHGPKDLSQVDKYGKLAYEKTIKDAISIYEI